VLGAFFFCGYGKPVTSLFCVVIHTCYFVYFNRRSDPTVSSFVVVLLFVDVERRCIVCVRVLVRATAGSL